MIGIRLPNITAKDEAGQLQQVRSYLHQLVGELNYALSTIESGSSTQAVGRRVAQASASATQTDSTSDSFNQIKSLIIKSADIINVYSEEITKRLKGVYVAQSDFGTYSEQTTSDITANSKSIAQAYENIQTIIDDVAGISKKIITNAHIKSGLLYYAGEDGTEYSSEIPNGAPIYGLEIGQRITNSNGDETFNKYARFTSNKLSFYDQNDVEVAYISDSKLFITHVEITGSLTHGGFIDTTRSDKSVITRWIGG